MNVSAKRTCKYLIELDDYEANCLLIYLASIKHTRPKTVASKDSVVFGKKTLDKITEGLLKEFKI